MLAATCDRSAAPDAPLPSVILIETEGAFNPKRVQQIAQESHPELYSAAMCGPEAATANLTSLLSRIIVFREDTSHALLARITALDAVVLSGNSCGSSTATFCYWAAACSHRVQAQRTSALSSLTLSRRQRGKWTTVLEAVGVVAGAEWRLWVALMCFDCQSWLFDDYVCHGPSSCSSPSKQQPSSSSPIPTRFQYL